MTKVCLFSLFYQAQFVTIIYVWNYTFIHYETILIRIFWYYETFYVFSTTAGSSHNVSGVWMLHIVTRSRPAHSCLLIQTLCDPNPYSDLHLTFIEKAIVRCEATRLSCNIQSWKGPSNPQIFFTPCCLPPATPYTLSYPKPPTNVCY